MLSKTFLGMPVKNLDGNLFMRITELRGSEFEGLHSIVYASTPHGNTLETGIAYLREFDSEEDHNKLEEFEKSFLESTDEKTGKQNTREGMYHGFLTGIDYQRKETPNDIP